MRVSQSPPPLIKMNAMQTKMGFPVVQDEGSKKMAHVFFFFIVMQDRSHANFAKQVPNEQATAPLLPPAGHLHFLIKPLPLRTKCEAISSILSFVH